MSAPASPHYFEFEDAGGVAVVRFTTKAIRDERIIRSVFDQLDRLIEEPGRKKLILNFAGVEAFASYAIGKLIVLNNKLQAPAGRLALCSLTPIVEEIIDIMKLRRLFNLYRDEQEALQSFK
jgi:anti-sigma B factor antagonist